MIKRGIFSVIGTLQISFIAALVLFSSHGFSKDRADTVNIKKHLIELTKTRGFRTYNNLEQLNKAADYIHQVFSEYSDSVYFQKYEVNGSVYKNVIASFGMEHRQRVIVGAHYDVCGHQEGADDNASGVVGLLELAKMLSEKKTAFRIDLVAYTLEEPPFFRTEQMGSYIHAKSLIDQKVEVKGMVCLEMIGYFKDAKNTQEYPVGCLSLFYGKKGNYITLVNKFGSGKFARKFSRKYKSVANIRTKKFLGPRKLPGIDFSDHLNYWKFGFSALMITDTAFYRNKNYHEHSDTLESLDLNRMAQVINGVFDGLMKF